MILQAYNFNLVQDTFNTFIIANANSGDSSISVNNYKGLSDNDYLVVGEIGTSNAELIQISDGSLDEIVSLNSSLANNHYKNEPVYVVDYNQVQFYHSSESVDANSDASSLSQIGSNTEIVPYREYTEYQDSSNTSGYGYIRFRNATTSAVSQYSDPIPYEELAYNTVSQMASVALRELGLSAGDTHATISEIIMDVNEGINSIQQFQDWSFEFVENNTVLTAETYENTYDLSQLKPGFKYPNSFRGIYSVRVENKPLEPMSLQDWEDKYQNAAYSYLTSSASPGDTTLTLDDTSDFAESGTVYVGGNIVEYSSKNDSTDTLSGIPTSGDGAITSSVPSGRSVWQNVTPGIPTAYTIFNNKLYLDVPVEMDKNGKTIKIKYLKKIPSVDSFMDSVDIPFYEAITKHIKYKTTLRRKNWEEAGTYRQEYNNIVKNNSQLYQAPHMDSYKYYNFYAQN